MPGVYLKLGVLLLWIGVSALIVWLLQKARFPRIAQGMVQLSYRGIARIVGLRIAVKGAASPARPLLMVSNHTSYLDIIVLGATTDARFTPKADIAGWPVIGAICRLTGCIFIDRRVSKTSDNLVRLREAMASGEAVVLFPEGTTGDGARVLPFRSSYFQLAEEEMGGQKIVIQPVTIAYTHLQGLPVDSTQRPLIAWYGDMALTPHLFTLLRQGPIQAQIIYHPVLNRQDADKRKEMANHCGKVVAQGYESLDIINLSVMK